MEKLQDALNKARAKRNTLAGSPGPQISGGAGAARMPQASGPAEELWAALPEAELDIKHLNKRHVVSHSYTRESSAFDILRTKVVLQMRKHGWRRMAITSATPVCGKTTVSCNLAIGLSRQTELQSIVMDFDLRNPSMSKMLGVAPPRDMTKLLEGEVPFAEQALRVGPSVAISMTKRSVVDPTSDLLGINTETILSQIERDYAPDLMIFDTAPIMVSDDTRAFLSQVDCAMVVACAERTTIAQIDACEREIAEHTNVIGVVLNQARFMDEDQGYGYGYGYGYGHTE